jgi:glycosyltransferase involved in cell wall biosynthesis
MTPSGRPLHIGIVCDYDFTLLPHSGIGVFVYNLIEGLLSLTPHPRITLLVNPGDQEKLKEWAERHSAGVTISPPLEQSSKGWIRFGRLARHWHWRCQNLQDLLQARLGKSVDPSLTKKIFLRLLIFLIDFATLALHSVHRFFQKLSAVIRPLQARVAAAGCDVWLVPFPGTRSPIFAPHVLVIFDMVFRHVPEVYSPQQRRHAELLFAERARQATLIYCGSNFVKEHDLVPCYPFAADRIRVFRLAPPMDIQSDAEIPDLTGQCSKYKIGNEFLFYPAGLRVHKNHAMLIRALNVLRQNHGHSNLELALTGEERRSDDLRRLVQSEGLTDQVHFLGLVGRQDIQALYRHALLVPLPSLHEGYGLPLLEALQRECPVVCADISAFRELLEDQSDAVLFFNPHDAESIAEAISKTLARRDEFRDRQRHAFQQIAHRDWHAVAKDFLQIFEEAYRLSAGNQTSPSSLSGTVKKRLPAA